MLPGILSLDGFTVARKPNDTDENVGNNNEGNNTGDDFL